MPSRSMTSRHGTTALSSQQHDRLRLRRLRWRCHGTQTPRRLRTARHAARASNQRRSLSLIPKPGVNFVEKTDVNQSNVLIVGLGTERSNPDYYALSVMNEVFSGGFGSRVVQNVRTKLGLAYSVGGSFSASYDHPGIFYVHGCAPRAKARSPQPRRCSPRSSASRPSLPRPAELRKAKDQVLNSFIFHYDSPDKTLNEQVTLAFYGYPADTLESTNPASKR